MTFQATPEIDTLRAGRTPMLQAYWELIRPRIVGLVLFTLAVSAAVAGPELPDWRTLVHALIGSGLVVAGAIVMNQRLERSSDARMTRTSRRPIPAGRISATEAGWIAAAASVGGLIHLAGLVNWPTVVLAAVSWLIYVWVYTPLKAMTAWQTPIGAIAGAMPALLGAAAAGALFTPTAWALFGIVCLWQFPHAMAIAWLYRRDYAAAELRLITVADPSGRTAGWWAVSGAIALIPVSLVPWAAGSAGWGFGVVGLLLGAGYLAASLHFFHQPDDRAARRLLLTSVAHLPLLLLALLAATLV